MIVGIILQPRHGETASPCERGNFFYRHRQDAQRVGTLVLRHQFSRIKQRVSLRFGVFIHVAPGQGQGVGLALLIVIDVRQAARITSSICGLRLPASFPKPPPHHH